MAFMGWLAQQKGQAVAEKYIKSIIIDYIPHSGL